MAEIDWSEEPEHLDIQRTQEIIESVRGHRYTHQTVINWVREFNLGWQPAKWGNWIIVRDKLKEFLNGK